MMKVEDQLPIYFMWNVGNVSCAVFEASPSVIALSVISLFIFEASPTKPRSVQMHVTMCRDTVSGGSRVRRQLIANTI